MVERRRVVTRAPEEGAERWRQPPHSHDESALAPIAAWGPAEDWSDWAEAAR